MCSCWKKIAVLAILLVSAATVYGLTPFEDGETVIFLGDSITHGGGYIYWCQAMYPMRTSKKVRLINAGISGESAGGGLARLDSDVLTYKPNRVFIMFGMNDLGRQLYEKSGSNQKEKRLELLKKYEENLNRICDRLKKEQVTAVLITPTPFNQYGKGCTSTYNEEGLAEAAKIVRKIAMERNLEVVDFFQPMTELLKKKQDVPFIRPDNVHPNSLGHLLMMYYIAKEMNFSKKNVRVGIDAESGEITYEQNAVIRNLEVKSDVISWKYTSENFPFILDNRLEKIDQLVPFTKDFNSEILKVSKLKEGKYRLLANDCLLGTYTKKELAAGVNLAELNTPTKQQARKDIQTIREIRKCYEALRNVVHVERMFKNQNVDLNNVYACSKAADEWYNKNYRGKNDQYAKYYAGVIKKYKENKKKVPEIQEKLDGLYKQLSQDHYPNTYKMQLEKVE